MILKHLLNHEFSWEELDHLTRGKSGESTSPAAAQIGMTELGLEATLIAEFNHREFIQRGIDYIRDNYGDEMADWQLANGDIQKSKDISHELLSSPVLYEHRGPQLDDIRKYLDEGYTLYCGLNSKIIDNERGYRGHSVVVLSVNEKIVELHDPGLPPRPHRKVTTELFIQAWQSHGTNLRAVRLPN